MAVWAELHRGQRNIRAVHWPGNRIAVSVINLHAGQGHIGHIALFQKDDITGGRKHCRDIRGDEVFTFAQADQERAAHARGDQALGFVAVDDRDGISAFQILDRPPGGGQQVPAFSIVMMYQMADDLGIGLRFEHVAERAQAFALLLVVFDDAVVHQRQFAGADVRMRIEFGDAAVGGPARVPDADLTCQGFGLRRRFHFGHAAGTTHAFDAVGHDRDAGGIVATVLEALESVDQKMHHIPLRYRSNNTAHKTSLG